MSTITPLATLTAAAMALAACSTSSSPNGPGSPAGSSGDGSDWGDSAAEAAVAEDLVFLREEEKLARDVYITMFEAWGLPIFDDISQSEQRHMDAVLVQLERFGLPDPVIDDAVGAFQNPELGKLYVELVDRGLESQVQALTVGATIEDLDIRDIDDMEGRTEDAAVLDTYGRLKCGSGNHMRAFHGWLADEGVTYEPQFISDGQLATILAAPQERCGRGGR